MAQTLNEVVPLPPSQQSAQGPVPKPGEPLGVTMGPSPQPPPTGSLPPDVLPPVEQPDPKMLHRVVGSTDPGPQIGSAISTGMPGPTYIPQPVPKGETGSPNQLNQ